MPDSTHVHAGGHDDHGGEQGAHDADCRGHEAEDDSGRQRRLQQVQGVEGNTNNTRH